MAVGNNLYPPIIATYMPAFIRTSPCKVYFSLSSFNSPEDIMNVQITVSNINTNESVLRKSLYPSDIKISQLNIDTAIQTDEKYYIIINPGDVQQSADGMSAFELNQFYKVQLRFTAVGAEQPPETKIAAWLLNNQKYFSEWSTVCLIKGIEQPVINLHGLENSSSQIIFTTKFQAIVGSMSYSANANVETETLKAYSILIATADAPSTYVVNSGTIYTDSFNPNEINYPLKYELKEDQSYILTFTYITKNNYTATNTYKFIINAYSIEKLDATITAELNEEEGYISINIKNDEIIKFYGNLLIRRTSNLSNFAEWEDIHIINVKDTSTLDVTWNDFSIESGVWYKYGFQKIFNDAKSPLVKMQNAILATFEYSFLNGTDRQLKLKFDAAVSSFKPTVLESKTDTLGGQYPIIRRNGKTNYKQFTLSGLISSYQDEFGTFTTKDELYGESKQDYDDYNSNNDINKQYDYILEAAFRNKVLSFLNDNTVKLFRSPTEGNILIKLMNISLSPKEELGRMLYTFSANAYEIDTAILDNLFTYKVFSQGQESHTFSSVFFGLGQLQTSVKAGTDIIQMIQNQLNKKANTGFDEKLNYLSHIKISFESDPVLLTEGIAGPEVVKNGSNPANSMSGYLISLNGNPIIINQKGYYELSNTKITSFSVLCDCKITLDYVYNYTETAKEDNQKAMRIEYINRVGQLQGIYNSTQDIIQKIYTKYLQNQKSFYQRLVTVNGISIEADPHTVLYIQDAFDSQEYKHEVGDTGILTLYNTDTAISKMHICGIHLLPFLGENLNKMRLDQYYNTQTTATSVEEVLNPIDRGVYTIGSQRMIYYRGQWLSFPADNILNIPVEALINYHCEILKGEYL